ncbi:AIPR family protein [Bifidobacterium sp. B4081]|nr:AIPR family protein [Bifidobacterium sp. B4077]MCX8646381.1 AIPR family protein [Bifidobacterium sp. B4081]MCX8667989.1 AIPR family protein [Bifidobacterium sp. B3998]MCX8687442.1 AIPR family protein [Bifidobacterium sp. B4142]
MRVITSKDEGIRQDIITGTNNQNSIRKLQLHANDELQIRIENYLSGYD